MSLTREGFCAAATRTRHSLLQSYNSHTSSGQEQTWADSILEESLPSLSPDSVPNFGSPRTSVSASMTSACSQSACPSLRQGLENNVSDIVIELTDSFSSLSVQKSHSFCELANKGKSPNSGPVLRYEYLSYQGSTPRCKVLLYWRELSR